MFFILFWMGPHLRHFHTISFWVGSRDPNKKSPFLTGQWFGSPSRTATPQSYHLDPSRRWTWTIWSHTTPASAPVPQPVNGARPLPCFRSSPSAALRSRFFFFFHSLVVLDENIPLIPGINLLVYIGMVWNSWPQKNGQFTALLGIYNDQFISPFHEGYPDVR